MMTNLFSMFDPATSYYMSLNWISLFMFMLMVHYSNYNSHTRISMMFEILKKFMKLNFKNNLNNHNLKSMILLMMLFIFIYWNNILGIMPFIFTSTTHISVSLAMAFPFWMSMFLKGWSTSTNKMFTHLLPTSTPMILAPFMVIIETISMIIRPLTLCIRLSANMIAGHILISLLSKTLMMSNMTLIPIYMIMNIMLILEISVAMIQSYVFVMLMSLYLNEV